MCTCTYKLPKHGRDIHKMIYHPLAKSFVACMNTEDPSEGCCHNLVSSVLNFCAHLEKGGGVKGLKTLTSIELTMVWRHAINVRSWHHLV